MTMQPPRANAAQKVTAWSAGTIAFIIAAPIVLTVVCCLGCFALGGLGMVFGGSPTPTPTP